MTATITSVLTNIYLRIKDEKNGNYFRSWDFLIPNHTIYGKTLFLFLCVCLFPLAVNPIRNDFCVCTLMTESNWILNFFSRPFCGCTRVSYQKPSNVINSIFQMLIVIDCTCCRSLLLFLWFKSIKHCKSCQLKAVINLNLNLISFNCQNEQFIAYLEVKWKTWQKFLVRICCVVKMVWKWDKSMASQEGNFSQQITELIWIKKNIFKVIKHTWNYFRQKSPNWF